MIACSAGHLDIAKSLLERGANPRNANSNKVTSLHYAASRSRIEICKILIEKGADVNATDQYGYTPLHRAASKGNTEVVKLLLECPDIRIDSQDAYGNTPL